MKYLRLIKHKYKKINLNIQEKNKVIENEYLLLILVIKKIFCGYKNCAPFCKVATIMF